MRPEASQTFSTADVAPGQRVDRWNAFGSETFARLTADPDDADAFQASLTRAELGGLGFGWLTTSASTARGEGQVGAWAAPSRDAFLLLVQQSGQSRAEQDGREALMTGGDLILWDATRPWCCQALGEMSLTVVKLPVERLLRRLGDPEALAGVSLKGAAGAAAFASSVIRLVRPALSQDDDEGVGEAVADMVMDAVALAYGRVEPDPREPHRRTAFRREACAFIEARLENPELTVADVAEGLGVSMRRLQRTFIQAGSTPRQYILQRRLDLAAERLRRSPQGHGAITEIALALGFNDPGYFARAFARRHGAPPRAYRRRFQA